MSSESPPFDYENLISAAAHALVRKNRQPDAELLAMADIALEEVGYDNWDGGTVIWELSIALSYPEYLAIDVERRGEIETFIDEAVKPFLPDVGHWVHAKIKPAEFRDPNWRDKVTTKARSTPGIEEARIRPSNARKAFISYQIKDKRTAGRIQQILAEVGVTAFLAHEDIEVSAIWRERILEELGKSTIFVSLLSENYFGSHWCLQESGIAAFRNMTSIHLSLDGSIPSGFSGNVQSTKIDPDTVSLIDLLPGIVASDFDFGISLIINRIARSGSFRGAEANFHLILPYLERLSDFQIKELLERSAENNQVHHANLCASEYIPHLLESHGHILDDDVRNFLNGICDNYRA